LEAKTISLQQHETIASQQLKSLQERLEQEETTVAALRREMTDMEQQLRTITQAHNDVRL